MSCVYIVFVNDFYGDETIELVTDKSKIAEDYLIDRGYELDEKHTGSNEKGYSKNGWKTDYFAEAYIRRVILNIPMKW